MRDLLRRALTPLVYSDGFAVITPRLNATWPQRRFLRRLLLRLGVDCVFDVGANVGQYAIELRNCGYRGLILSFEPDPGCFAELSSRSAGDPRWHVFNLALGRAPGKAPFNVMVVSLFNSFRTPTSKDTTLYAEPNTVRDTITVDVQTLDQIVPGLKADHGFTTPFLKMDTQGFDNDVFAGAHATLRSFVGMQSEVAVKKLYEGVVDWKEAITAYEATGLTLAGLFAVNAEREELIEFDCYFVQSGGRVATPEIRP